MVATLATALGVLSMIAALLPSVVVMCPDAANDLLPLVALPAGTNSAALTALIALNMSFHTHSIDAVAPISLPVLQIPTGAVDIFHV
jgi:hypothetical protein